MEETLAFRIVCLYKYFLAYSRKELKKLGVSFGQLPFILYAGKHPGCSQKELTEGIRIDWGYSQRTITKLAENGLILKESGEDQNYHLSLTETGEKVFALSHELFRNWDEKQTGSLSESERRELSRLLDELLQGKGAEL